MINDYLNQLSDWSAKTGDNGYAEAEYAIPTSIPVRWEDTRKLVRNAQGKEVISEATVICIADVNTDDLLTYNLRDYPVITVSDLPDLDGEVLFREVYV